RRAHVAAMVLAVGGAAAACQSQDSKPGGPQATAAEQRTTAPAQPASRPAWTISPQLSDFAPAGNTAEPQLTAWNDRALLSWVESTSSAGLPGKATLKFSERTSSGWSAPTEVASGNNWFVNSADVPAVLRLSDNMLAASWLVGNSEEND